MKTPVTRLWYVSVYAERAHTNPSWTTRVYALNKQAAIICAMTLHDGPIDRVECEGAVIFGSPSPEWTGE